MGRVQQACADLARLPGATNVELQRLDPAGVRASSSPRSPAATDVDVDAWYERSQGNPYLLGELVKDPGARRVKDVLLSRVHALGPDAAELVRLAAVFGLWVADDQLHAASVLAAGPLRRRGPRGRRRRRARRRGRRLRLPAQP